MAQRSFRVGEATFAVRTTSGPFFEWLERTLEAYAVDEEAPVHYSVVVDGGEDQVRRGGRGFHILYRGTVAVARTLHLPTAARALLCELDALTFPQREEAIYLRAGLVRSNGTMALVPDGMVQTLGRLGRRVERRGLALGATRFVAVDPASGRVVPAPSTLAVPDGALDELPAGTSPPGPPDRFFLDEAAAVDLLVALGIGGGSVVPLSRALALGRLSASAVNLPRLGARALAGLAELVGAARCYALAVDGARGMLESLTALLGEGGGGPPERRERDEPFENGPSGRAYS